MVTASPPDADLGEVALASGSIDTLTPRVGAQPLTWTVTVPPWAPVVVTSPLRAAAESVGRKLTWGPAADFCPTGSCTNTWAPPFAAFRPVGSWTMSLVGVQLVIEPEGSDPLWPLSP